MGELCFLQKAELPGVGYLPLSMLVGGDLGSTPNNTEQSVVLSCPAEPDVETLVLKISHILVVEHAENKETLMGLSFCIYVHLIG